MTERKTQLDRIVEILERDGQMDNFYAIHNRISLRLGARIWDLRARGYRIETEEKSDKNTILPSYRYPQTRAAYARLIVQKRNGLHRLSSQPVLHEPEL
jgi:hypothetical protein